MKTQTGHSVATIVSFSAPAFAFIVALTIGLVFGPTDKSDQPQKEPSGTEQSADSNEVTGQQEGEPQEEE